MQTQWIEDSGSCQERELSDLLNNEVSDTSYYLAGLTDQYLSGMAGEEELNSLDLEKLLEIRIFSDEHEFLARRSFLGQPFQWRIASEKNCKDDPGAYIVRYQYLDINEEKTSDLNDGKLSLMTTVGGRYSLPINRGIERVKIIVYLDYDSEGMASVADYRVCGFRRDGEGEI